jgi:hypothetical protein
MFVDVRHTNTQPLLPLIFIIDSSVKTTFFQYIKVLFLIWFLAQRRPFFLLVALIKGFLRTWRPLYPKDFSRGRVILPRIRFWISSPHFCDKALAVALLSSFTNFTSCLCSLGDVFSGLPLLLTICTFPCSRNCRKIVATVSLGLLYYCGYCCSTFSQPILPRLMRVLFLLAAAYLFPFFFVHW